MKGASLRFLILLVAFQACSKDPDVRDLEQAARVVEQMVAPLNAPRTSFFVVLPNGTPREFVSWFFSTMGVADWPPLDEPSELSQDELDAMRQMGMALRPKDVYYNHTKPDPSVQKQIVLTWDDAEGTVILEGYLDPNQPPAFKKSFKLPRNVVPDQMARLAVQSNIELGMSFQSF